MGGSSTTSTENESGLAKPPCFSSDDESSSSKLENGSMISEEIGLGVPDSVSEAIERQKNKVYAQVCKCYAVDLDCGTERLQKARGRVLRYYPGSNADKIASYVCEDKYVVPETTCLLLLGPKASGKSTLVNNISKVFDGGSFASRRAHVPGYSAGDGTWYVQRYMIAKHIDTISLYDTRSLSRDKIENLKEIERWMTKGVSHGELVLRESDSRYKAQLMYGKSTCPSQLSPVNFVIFVVNGVSVLDAMDGDNDLKREYWQDMASIFNNPLLSFRDDKPVVVVTHGDLLSVSDRVRVRLHLAELLGIHPTQEMFDIPDETDPATALEIVYMITYCLERADRNLGVKKQPVDKMLGYSFVGRLLLLMVLAIAIYFQIMDMVNWHQTRQRFNDNQLVKLQ